MRQILACACLLLLLGCAKKTETGVSVDPAFARLVPSGATLLAGFRVDKIEATPLYQKYGGTLKLAALSEFSSRTGLDPSKDISSLLVAYDGKQSMAFARGHFSEAAIKRKLASYGARPTTYKGYTLFGTDRGVILFIKPDLAVAGSGDALQTFVDDRDRHDSGIPADLEDRLKALPTVDQVYVVSSTGIPLSAFPSRSDVQSALSNIVEFINGLTFGLAVDEGVHLSAQIDCISDAGAKRVDDAFRGAIGLARLATKDNQLDLLRLYDAVQVDQQQSSVRIHADISGDLFGKLLEAYPRLRDQQ